MRLFSLIVTLSYLAAWAGYVKLLLADSEKTGRAVNVIVRAAVTLDVLYMIALRSALKHPPLTSGAEATAVLALMLALIYLILERYSESKSVGALIFLVVTALQGVSTTFIRYAPGAPQFNSTMLFIHVGIALVGYAAFIIAFLYSVLYLVLYGQLQRAQFGLLFRRLPSLEEMDETTYRASLFGFMLLVASILMGMAQVGVGQLLMGDPKVMVTIFTAQIYLIVLVFKTMFGWHGRRIAILSIIGFLAIVLSIILLNVMPYTFHNVYY